MWQDDAVDTAWPFIALLCAKHLLFGGGIPQLVGRYRHSCGDGSVLEWCPTPEEVAIPVSEPENVVRLVNSVTYRTGVFSSQLRLPAHHTLPLNREHEQRVPQPLHAPLWQGGVRVGVNGLPFHINCGLVCLLTGFQSTNGHCRK
jgi:hypothetical protein